MDEPSRQLAAAVLEALRIGETEAALRKYARFLSRSDADAEDLFNEALSFICDPLGKPWSADRGSFLGHARIVLRDTARNLSRGLPARREVLVDPAALEEGTAGTAASPEDALEEAQDRAREARLGAILRERLADRPRVLAVLEHRAQGVEDMAEIATLCGVPIAEVYDANRHIRRVSQSILEEEAHAASLGATRRVTVQATWPSDRHQASPRRSRA